MIRNDELPEYKVSTNSVSGSCTSTICGIEAEAERLSDSVNWKTSQSDRHNVLG